MVRRTHKPRLYRILAVGDDISRLSSRANVLTQAGYNTDLALSVDHAVRRTQIRPYELVIVSHSFGFEKQILIRARLRRIRHDLPVLLLTPEHELPDVFLSAVADCLKHKMKYQFGVKRDDHARDIPAD